MSHFSTIKTRMVNKKYLKKALADLELAFEEGCLEVRGYNGQRTQVEIKIPTRNPGYDLGFRRSEQAYELVADWYGIKDIEPEELLQKISQRYAYHAVKEQLEGQEFTLVEEEVHPDRTIHLVVRRMV